jgi:hypothetical protein
VSADGTLREQLEDWCWQRESPNAGFHDGQRQAWAAGARPDLDDLAELVDAYAAQKAAEELRAAAAEQRREADQVPWEDEGTHADGHRCAADFIDRRAGALEATANATSGPASHETPVAGVSRSAERDAGFVTQRNDGNGADHDTTEGRE